MMDRRPWCLLCPSNYSLSPASMHIYDYLQLCQRRLGFHRYKKKEELTLKSIFIFMVLLSKAYKEKKGLYEYLVSKKCCSSDVYL